MGYAASPTAAPANPTVFELRSATTRIGYAASPTAAPANPTLFELRSATTRIGYAASPTAAPANPTVFGLRRATTRIVTRGVEDAGLILPRRRPGCQESEVSRAVGGAGGLVVVSASRWI